MRGGISFYAAAVLILTAGSVQAEVYDFNAIATGCYTEAALSSHCPGISFNNTGGKDFYVDTVSNLDLDFSGNAVLNWPYDTPGNSTVATFDLPVTFFSVTMGDYNADADTLFLYAYNADNSNVAIDFKIFNNPATSYAGHTLSVASMAGDIARVEFYGVGAGDGNYNSVYWDNVAFTPVPVPAAVLLGMLGLGVAGLKLRKFV